MSHTPALRLRQLTTLKVNNQMHAAFNDRDLFTHHVFNGFACPVLIQLFFLKWQLQRDLKLKAE